MFISTIVLCGIFTQTASAALRLYTVDEFMTEVKNNVTAVQIVRTGMRHSASFDDQAEQLRANLTVASRDSRLPLVKPARLVMPAQAKPVLEKLMLTSQNLLEGRHTGWRGNDLTFYRRVDGIATFNLIEFPFGKGGVKRLDSAESIPVFISNLWIDQEAPAAGRSAKINGWGFSQQLNRYNPAMSKSTREPCWLDGAVTYTKALPDFAKNGASMDIASADGSSIIFYLKPTFRAFSAQPARVITKLLNFAGRTTAVR